MAFTASVSRVLSSSTTSESTKSSSAHAVFSVAMALPVNLGLEPEFVERREEARPLVVERRRRADAQRAVFVARHVELDVRLDLALVDVGVDARLLVHEL